MAGRRTSPGWRTLLGLVATLAWLPAVAQAGNYEDLGSVLSKHPDISTYYDLIKKNPDILLQLPNTNGVTIIAPNNDAFAKYQGWSPDNRTLVANLLEYHVLQGTLATAAVAEGPASVATTLLSNKAYSNVTGGQKVVVYKQPDDAVVFASGSGSRSTLVEGDITFAGGLVQVVDTLLVPPARLEPTARDSYGRDLAAFVGALYAAGMLPRTAEMPNVTIFAPRNDAFQRVAGALEALSRPMLARVLDYHVVPHALLPSPALANGTRLTTASAAGAALLVTRAGNDVYVNSARVVQPDILVANGVVHILDAVLSPDAPGALPDPARKSQAPVFDAGDATTTGARVPVPFTSALPCTADCADPTTSVDATTGTSGVRSSSSHGGAAAAARCTRLVEAGVLGVGMAMGVAGLV